MKTTIFDSAIQVKVGEVFGVKHQGLETSGYQTEIDVPSGVAIIGSDRQPGLGMGGAPDVVECFRCEKSGNFKITVRQKRPWETEPAVQAFVYVSCSRS